MQPNPMYLNQSDSFWAYTKLISEQVGYSKGGVLKTYKKNKVLKKLEELNINITEKKLDKVLGYLNYRSDILNNTIQHYFMNAETAREAFRKLQEVHTAECLQCKLPFNKQKHEKKDYAYFTGIINIIAELTIRDYAKEHNLKYGKDIHFDDDPRNLCYVQDHDTSELLGIMSRRFDGVYPSHRNPIAIWEIKEYYYTTTFGSRISDGIYETQLDGFEINQISDATDRDIKHIYFIDDYNTWWNMGKSYLCRIIDMMHVGLVDEVLFGREVLERWEPLLREIIEENESRID